MDLAEQYNLNIENQDSYAFNSNIGYSDFLKWLDLKLKQILAVRKHVVVLFSKDPIDMHGALVSTCENADARTLMNMSRSVVTGFSGTITFTKEQDPFARIQFRTHAAPGSATSKEYEVAWFAYDISSGDAIIPMLQEERIRMCPELTR